MCFQSGQAPAVARAHVGCLLVLPLPALSLFAQAAQSDSNAVLVFSASFSFVAPSWPPEKRHQRDEAGSSPPPVPLPPHIDVTTPVLRARPVCNHQHTTYPLRTPPSTGIGKEAHTTVPSPVSRFPQPHVDGRASIRRLRMRQSRPLGCGPTPLYYRMPRIRRRQWVGGLGGAAPGGARNANGRLRPRCARACLPCFFCPTVRLLTGAP